MDQQIDQLADRIEALAEAERALTTRVAELEALHETGEAWSVKRFAKYLDIAPKTLRQMMAASRVPYHVIGNRKKILPGDREAFLGSMARGPRPGETTGTADAR